MTFEELLATYPAEIWVEETDEEDGYCRVCDVQEEPCRERIRYDVYDIQRVIHRFGAAASPAAILAWLQEKGYSTLTHSTTDLARHFLAATEERSEQVLCEVQSAVWRKAMPVTLITYNGARRDLHCQTGDHHEVAIRRASVILAQRGLGITPGAESVCGTGVYYSVAPLMGIDRDVAEELVNAGAL